MHTGHRFRCYPTPDQKQTLLRWIGCQRAIYNAKVSEDRYYRTFARKSLQHTGQYAPQDQTYAQFVTDSTPWFREVPSRVLRNGATRWKRAYARYWKKLAGRPVIQRKTGPQSVWLTSEVFRFEPAIDEGSRDSSYRLHIGIKKFPVGEIRYTAHRAHAIPASITLTVDAGRWYLSFAIEDGVALPSAQDTVDWLSGFTETELTERTVGIDRGVVIPVMCSNDRRYGLSAVQQARIAKKQAAARRWQRKLSRRTKGSANRRKAIRRIAALRRYEKDVRRDCAHQASHQIVGDPKTLLIVFEALGVQRMTKKPKAKPDPDHSGRWLQNGARAKAGLNRAILGSLWGQTKEFCTYKARRVGKLAIDVPPHYSSLECAVCGHTHLDNRPIQAGFVCQHCGHTGNADANASRVIRSRGVELILSGEYREKAAKRTMRLGTKRTPVGTDCSDRAERQKACGDIDKSSEWQRSDARVAEAGNPYLQDVPRR